MSIIKAKSEITDAIAVHMAKYRQVTEWRRAAQVDVFGNPSQYDDRIKQIGDTVECLKQAEGLIDRAISIESQETANDSEGDSQSTENPGACA
jgi:hypothetical protein